MTGSETPSAGEGWASQSPEPPTSRPADPSSDRPHGAAADPRAQTRSLSDRFRRHADALTRDHRSPLSAALMYSAADDLDADGRVAKLFEPVPNPPGSVPQLRLLGALHHLVLSGQALELASFYPSAGGVRQGAHALRATDARRAADVRPAADVWPVAERVIEEHFDWIQNRLRRTVQTNEPGRSTVLYAALLWLTARYRLPIRLLEIGASAGLNLLADRFCYVGEGQELGESASPVRFIGPWQPGPPIDVSAAAQELQISERAGCDEHPLNPQNPEDRTTLLSFIWPDETERFQRNLAALELAAAAPARVDAATASEWLPGALSARRDSELTVLWQSVFRQYVAPGDWTAIEAAVRGAAEERPAARVAWLMMEPGEDHLAHMRLTLREPPHGGEETLASCGDHGPPVAWARTDR